ncbi:MAG: hypothetical protein K9L85_02570 [Candidatus Peribacteraceae bacterium]|nr:hypothetical protein [Candidatus Peribacteraceae bacterium]
MLFSFSEERLLIRGSAAEGRFTFRERFLIQISNFERAEHARITADAVVLVREIRGKLGEFYRCLGEKIGNESLVKIKQKIGDTAKNLEQKRGERDFIEAVVLSDLEKAGSIISFSQLLEEFEAQVLSGEIFGHLFLRRFEELLTHKVRNCLMSAIFMIPKQTRPTVRETFFQLENELGLLFEKIKELSSDAEVIEPIEPTKISCREIIDVCQLIIEKLGQEPGELQQFCFSPASIREFFPKKKLSEGETNLLRAAFFYLAEAIKFGKNDTSFDLEKAITNLQQLVAGAREHGSIRAPYKLLALQILQHVEISLKHSLQPDFVLNSFGELAKMLKDPYFSVKKYANPDPSVSEHVAREIDSQQASGGGLPFLK